MLSLAPNELAALPARPGAYLLLDGRGRILYVGRAGALRSRVRSYWSAGLTRPGLRGMVRRVRRIVVAPAASEHEAAFIERILLERLDPPFNRTQGVEVVVAMRLSSAPPGIAAAVELDSPGRHFGPFLGWAPTLAAASALARIFPLHLCRPAVELGTLQRELARRRGVSDRDVDALSARITAVLEDDGEALVQTIGDLERERDRASELRLYEQAAELQRQVVALRWITQPQRVMRLAPSGDGWIADEGRIAEIVGALS